jgi:AhpD family alkylhydroperoxidase
MHEDWTILLIAAASSHSEKLLERVNCLCGFRVFSVRTLEGIHGSHSRTRGVAGHSGPNGDQPENHQSASRTGGILLRGPNTLSAAERETTATYVSSLNDCCFCQLSHAAAAAEHMGGNYELIDQVRSN